MRLDALQQLRLEQKLKLAPRMIQSMEILQLSIAALEERIDQELEKNPLLELAETQPDAPEPPTDDAQTAQATETEGEFVVQDDNSNRDDFARLDNVEGDRSHFDYADFTPRRSSFDDEDPKLQALSNTASREVCLNEHLAGQWDLTESNDLTRQCGTIIIDNLDPDGYLRTDFDELAKQIDQPVPPQAWEEALALVQRLDPPGIAARTVQECLLLQLGIYDESRSLERLIITDHFEHLQKQQYTKIIHATGHSLDEIKSAVEFIRTHLILHPGLTVGAPNAPHIVPDVIIDYDEREGYTVTIADQSLPNLHVSGHYRRMLHSPAMDRQTKQFIRTNIQSAHWLIDAIEQRRSTLRRVTERIVEAQHGFLEQGPKALKPLPMAQVADELGIHVATVSRAVAGKYAQTPRGTLPLRMFFSGGTKTAAGESLSWDAVRAKIQDIIDHEDKTHPLPDDQIVELLRKDGIELARRTVTKYRKVMGVPSSIRRKES